MQIKQETKQTTHRLAALACLWLVGVPAGEATAQIEPAVSFASVSSEARENAGTVNLEVVVEPPPATRSVPASLPLPLASRGAVHEAISQFMLYSRHLTA